MRGGDEAAAEVVDHDPRGYRRLRRPADLDEREIGGEALKETKALLVHQAGRGDHSGDPVLAEDAKQVADLGGLPLSIFLLRAFFQSMPGEVEDAARIDGCSNFQTFLRVVLPVSTPGLATVTILQFMNAWNEFFLALIFIRRPELRTIPLGLQAFFFEFQVEWQYLFAALSMATVPVIVVYVLMQRQFIAGLTSGAVKG